MGDSSTEAIMMASYETPSTKFGKLFNLNDSNSGWKIEYAAGATPNWAVNSLNRAIKVTIDSGAKFKTDIAKYVDIESAIDYLLFLYFTTGQDNCSKNTIWATFDGETWITSVYDLDSTWGLYWDGTSLMSPSSVMPKKEKDGSFSSQTWSRIWEHIFQNFTEEIIARYSELRATVFTPENVEYEFTRFMAQIPDEAFELEYDHYPYIPSRNLTNLNQILRHHKNVLRHMDATFESMSQYYLGTNLKVYYN